MDLEVVVVLEALDKTEHHLRGGHGGLGIQLPSTFQDPRSSVGFPGPGPATFFVAGGGGGVSDDSEPTTGQGGGSVADLMLEQDLVHIILIQELQEGSC